jgi:hypothetical protein
MVIVPKPAPVVRRHNRVRGAAPAVGAFGVATLRTADIGSVAFKKVGDRADTVRDRVGAMGNVTGKSSPQG